MTKAQEEKLIKNHNASMANPTKDLKHKAIVKLFNPVGRGTWYLTEYNPKDQIAFGVADLGVGFPEIGSFALWELKELKLPMGCKIERDQFFTENKYTLDQCLDLCK